MAFDDVVRGTPQSVRAKSRRADVGSRAPSHSAPIVFLPSSAASRVGRRESRAAHELCSAPRQSGGGRAGGEDLVGSSYNHGAPLIRMLRREERSLTNRCQPDTGSPGRARCRDTCPGSRVARTGLPLATSAQRPVPDQRWRAQRTPPLFLYVLR